ncbi:hypothetical protein KP509_36G004400 [Ceratopteris richardii]|uniref:Uncharacterized protein n=1 Tax=Ceratopteris richardii TaxID=49495 RepID=A0A8T2Q9X5_CERRI|nr:hypothetical protein KP509_36G004400 [Ceratopteris richardii]
MKWRDRHRKDDLDHHRVLTPLPMMPLQIHQIMQMIVMIRMTMRLLMMRMIMMMMIRGYDAVERILMATKRLSNIILIVLEED